MSILFDPFGIEYSRTVGKQASVKLALLTFSSALEKDADAQTHADHIIASIVPLGKRFYPSESSFPLRGFATSPS